MQSRYQAQEAADRIPQADLFRLAGLHARGAASSGGSGRRQPGRARQRLSVPLAVAAGRPHFCIDIAERRRQGGYTGANGGENPQFWFVIATISAFKLAVRAPSQTQDTNPDILDWPSRLC